MPADPRLPAGAGPVSARPAAARSALRLALLLVALLAACTPGRPVPVAEIEAFIGVPLPPGHRGLRSADEAGIDRLMRLTFDAPEAEAAAFAGPARARGSHPGGGAGITLLGSGFDGWLTPCRRALPAAKRWWRPAARRKVVDCSPPVPACGASGRGVHPVRRAPRRHAARIGIFSFPAGSARAESRLTGPWPREGGQRPNGDVP